MTTQKKTKIKLNKHVNRMLFLSPSVALGQEDEATLTDFEILKMLGKGAFGKVFRVKHKKSLRQFAIKVIAKSLIKQYQMHTQMENEVRIMYSLKHPNLVALYNHFEDRDNIYLVLELSEEGQLYDKLKKKGRLDQKTAVRYMADLVCGLEYMHNQDPPIIHRDIKPENLLISKDGTLKLADFGWSNFGKGEKARSTYCGTPEYLAPEMVNESGHSEKLDIWTVGILLFELLVGHTPFMPKNAKDRATFEKSLHYNILNGKIKFPSDYPALARDLTQKLLKLDPKKRPSIEEIKKHPWFKNANIFDDEDKKKREEEKNKLEQSFVIDDFDEEDFYFDGDSMDEDDIPPASEFVHSYLKQDSVISKPLNLPNGNNIEKSKVDLIKSRFDSHAKLSINRIDNKSELVVDLSKKLSQKKDEILKMNLKLKNLREKNFVDQENLTKLEDDTKILKQEGVMVSNLEMKKFKMIEKDKERLENKYKELWSKYVNSDNEIDAIKAEIRNLQKIEESNQKIITENRELEERMKEMQTTLCDFNLENGNGVTDDNEIDVLNTTIKEYETKLFKTTSTNKQLALREILETSLRSFDEIKMTIYVNIENFVYDLEMKEQMNEINYELKKKDIEFENKIENEKLRIHEEFEDESKDLKREQLKEIENIELEIVQSREKYERKLSEMKNYILEIEAKMDAVDSVLELSMVKEDSFSDMKNTADAQKMVLKAKDHELKKQSKKIHGLSEKIKTLQHENRYLKKQIQIFKTGSK